MTKAELLAAIDKVIEGIEFDRFTMENLWKLQRTITNANLTN